MEEEQNNSKKNCLKVKIHIAHIAKHIVKVLHLDSVPFVRSSVALFTFSRFVSFYFVYGGRKEERCVWRGDFVECIDENCFRIDFKYRKSFITYSSREKVDFTSFSLFTSSMSTEYIVCFAYVCVCASVFECIYAKYKWKISKQGIFVTDDFASVSLKMLEEPKR